MVVTAEQSAIDMVLAKSAREAGVEAPTPSSSSSSAAAAAPSLCGTLDVVATALDAEVLLRGKHGAVLAVVLRNPDRALGRKLWATADFDDRHRVAAGTVPMADAGNNTGRALTSGFGRVNDTYDLEYETALASGEATPVVDFARAVVDRVCAARGVANGIFRAKPETLQCSLRAHAFPPNTMNGAPVAKGEDQFVRFEGQGPERVRSEEGGRMHPHRDEGGTDAVVLVNYGRAAFFTDIGVPSGGCCAQLTKQSWCIGNAGPGVSAPSLCRRCCRCRHHRRRRRPLPPNNPICSTGRPRRTAKGAGRIPAAPPATRPAC